jgi:phosphatidylserine/phosphatidylglycerophosphate/cardiolipin synthase-like enzyme
MVANRLYTSLNEEEKEYLNVYNYVAKDQTKPIHNKFKRRSCHVKILIADDQVAICGNGNQDTQSWFHSQEINVMIDSHTICAAWAEGIRRSQNTHLYGAVSKDDGCWHDPETGKLPEGSIGIDPGRFAWLKGVTGAIQRVRGLGGF